MSNNRKNISLSILDKYAKALSTSQVSKLYESRIKKQYNRMILEEQNIYDIYTLFVSNNAVTVSGLTNADFMNFITSGVPDEHYEVLDDVSFNTANPQGIWVSTNDPDSFITVLNRINELKIAELVEDSVKPRDFVQYLYPAQ